MAFKFTVAGLLLGILFGTTLHFKTEAVTWDEMTAEERNLPGAIFRSVKGLTNSYEDLRAAASYGFIFKTEDVFAASRAQYFNGMFSTARTDFLIAFKSISERQDLALCQNPGIDETYRIAMIPKIDGLYGNIQRIYGLFQEDLLKFDTVSSLGALKAWFNKEARQNNF